MYLTSAYYKHSMKEVAIAFKKLHWYFREIHSKPPIHSQSYSGYGYAKGKQKTEQLTSKKQSFLLLNIYKEMLQKITYKTYRNNPFCGSRNLINETSLMLELWHETSWHNYFKCSAKKHSYKTPSMINIFIFLITESRLL